MSVVIIIIALIICSVIAVCIKFVVLDNTPMKLAEKYASDNMINEAIAEYKKILAKSPNNMLVYYKIGNLYLKNKSADEGIACFEKIINSGKYDKDLSKHKVFKKLGKAYLLNSEVEKAFETYCDVINENPNDEEALLQTGFLLLGQEAFDIAAKTFERLLEITKNVSFEAYFAVGMTALQLSKISEAIKHFKSALKLSPESDIANLAVAFAFRKKNDYPNAIDYSQKVIKPSNGGDASFIAERLTGILHYQNNDANSAFKIYENLLNTVRTSRSEEELKMILYDIGFICIACEKSELAMNYWSELQVLDADYKKTSKLIIKLMQEIENNQVTRKDLFKDEALGSFIREWNQSVFPENYIWKICGLKASQSYNLRAIYDKAAEKKQAASLEDVAKLMEKLNNLDAEKLQILAGRVVQKMGYLVSEVLDTYKESDGVDLRGTSPNKASVLIWFRKWDGSAAIGEIPINDFAQAVRDSGADEGLFIATAQLVPHAAELLKTMPKIRFVSMPELSPMLIGLL